MRPIPSASSEQKFPTPETLVEMLKIGLPEFGWIDWVASTGSTNADLILRARTSTVAVRSKHEYSARSLPNPRPPWLLGAHLQTAGKGRAGRPWQNVAGECLMFSCAFEPQIPLAELPGIAPALGVATCLALRSLLGNPAPLQLKWPNDLQWQGAKLAGLLIETAPAFSGLASSAEVPKRPIVIVGMGLNLTGATALSEHLQRPIADLKQVLQSDALPSDLHGHHISPSTLITQVARAWQQALLDYKNNGYAAFSQAFDEVDALAEQHVQVIDQGKILHQGLAQGTDTKGRLNILTDTGLVPVLVGDVSIRPAGYDAEDTRKRAP